MNQTSIAFLILLILLCGASEHQASNSVMQIDINPQRISHSENKLSDFAESIEYIPLETTGECLIGQIIRFDISEKFIAIYCGMAKNAYLFHRDGRFINPIGNRGQGPGEYIDLSALLIDEKRSRIVIADIYKRLQLNYDLNGKFIDSRPIDAKTATGDYLRLHNDYLFVATENYFGNVPFVYEIRDMDLRVVSENIQTVYYERRDPSGMTGIQGDPHHYVYNDKIHTRELTLNDTIYSIERDFSFKPKYVVNAGRYGVTAATRAETSDRFFELMRSHVVFRNFFETKDKLLVHYHYDSKPFYGYYDIRLRRLFYFKSEKGIPNDIDGTVDFWPQRQDNQMWYTFYDAEHFSNTLDNVAPDDNPVLMIVKIKE